MEKTNWVDYKTIKAKVTMQMVLDRYHIEVKKSGKNYLGKSLFFLPIFPSRYPKRMMIKNWSENWKKFSR